MKKIKSTKSALISALLVLVMTVAMLAGTTFAWFTDSVTSANNVIKSGNLDIKLDYWNGTDWADVQGSSEILPKDALWEPGHTEVFYLRVSNAGSLAFKYQLGINIISETAGVNVAGQSFLLSDYIYFATKDMTTFEEFDTRNDALAIATDSKLISAGYSKEGKIEANGAPVYVAVVVYMPELVGNEANNRGFVKPEIELGIDVFATQDTVENDSFDNQFDADAALPEDASASIPAQSQTATTIKASDVSKVAVTVPAGAPEGIYSLTSRKVSETVDEAGNTSVAYDISLTKDGAAVSAIDYKVEINVGKELLVTSVKHNGNEVADYLYNPDTGIVSFTTTSFSPFEVTFAKIPEGAIAKVAAANGSVAYFESLNEAFASITDGATVTLRDNVAVNETVVFDKDVSATLDLAGFAISGQLTTLMKLTAGELTIKNGSIKNVFESATTTKYSIYMSGNAIATIKDVNIVTTGTSIYLTDKAYIRELDANVSSYMTAMGYCVFDAICLDGNARIELISGGSYENSLSAELIQAWYEDPSHKYSGTDSYVVQMIGEGCSIGEISGGEFLGVMDKSNNGAPIHVNSGTIEKISGGYFGFAKYGLTNPSTSMFVNTSNGASIGEITGGTFEKGSNRNGFNAGFESIINDSNYQLVETGKTVDVNIQFSSKVTTYTLNVVELTKK